jgi:hypothetical protein
VTRRVAPAWSRAIFAALALALAGAAPLRADPGCAAPVVSPSRSWPAPLDRPVSLQARDISLRTALDRLAAAARVDLAYSADLLPLDRPVCISRHAAALGDVLQELLRGSAAEAVVAAPGHVVLAPSRRADAGAAQLSMAPVALDRIVVTGTPGGSSERSLPIAVDVLGRHQLGAAASGTLAQALDAALPGMWAWEQSPSSLGVRYGSIRGASSFGVSYPKVYIDGIEVANPLLLSRFGSEGIERIEVIRGPQGAALYGTDAISGVVNVVTRHEGADSEGGRLRLRSSVGASSSRFGDGQSLAQEHELAARFGGAVRSAGVSVSGGSIGAFVPGGFERHLIGTATGRAVGQHLITTGTLRLSTQSSGAPLSPVIPAPVRLPPPPQPAQGGGDGTLMLTPGPQRARQYTAGINTTYTPDGRWTHTLVAGVDGDRLRGAQLEMGRTPLLEGTAMEASDGSADRGTLRASSVARLGTSAWTSGTVTFTGEHSELRESFTHRGDPRTATGGAPATWQRTTAGLAQGTLGLRDALFLTAGVRGEYNDALTGDERFAALPLVGAALVQERGNVRVKLRAAYGTGTRPPHTAPREAGGTDVRAPGAAALAPERQSGLEAGADLFVGRIATFRVTRFDQVATGLIQRVPLEPGPLATDSGAPRRDGRHIAFALQNVGRITNRGWEMQGTAELGRLSLTGAFSTVDSRVRRLADGYGGDLRVGDRTLEVPAWTSGLTATWAGRGWSAAGTAYRAGDWVGYDYVALSAAAADSTRADRDLVGAQLRGYWHTYTGGTHLRASATRDLPRGVQLLLTGDNLLGVQRGEPDNATILPGRTLTLGFRAQF